MHTKTVTLTLEILTSADDDFDGEAEYWRDLVDRDHDEEGLPRYVLSCIVVDNGTTYTDFAADEEVADYRRRLSEPDPEEARMEESKRVIQAVASGKSEPESNTGES